MQLAIISTIHNLEYSDEGEIYLCLAHLALRNVNYMNFFIHKRREGKHVILDNGVAEGITINPADYIELALKIKPAEIVLPDKLYDAAQTRYQAQHFLNFYRLTLAENNIRTIGVVQGSTLKQAKECYDYYLYHSGVHTIALPFAGLDFFDYKAISKTQRHALARIHFWRYIVDANPSQQLKSKPIHLLGLYNPYELKFYRDQYAVRSCDSISPVAHGAAGIQFSMYGIADKVSSAIHEKRLPKKAKNNIMFNINKLKEFASE